MLYCADIGSVAKGNFGWARLAVDDSGVSNIPSTGLDIHDFANNLVSDFTDGHRVALGFECPLFVPVPEMPEMLTSGRAGENNRPWSAGAGAASLATGLTETVWVLDRIRRSVGPDFEAHTQWQEFNKGGLFLWEAFVTAAAKAESHDGDAKLAVLEFHRKLPNPENHNAIRVVGRVRSLIGAAILQSGWSSDLAWLEKPCLVIKVNP